MHSLRGLLELTLVALVYSRVVREHSVVVKYLPTAVPL